MERDAAALGFGRQETGAAALTQGPSWPPAGKRLKGPDVGGLSSSSFAHDTKSEIPASHQKERTSFSGKPFWSDRIVPKVS